MFGQTSFTKSDLKHGFCATNSATLPQYAGHRWLAVGDAAMSFDPLSSQGIFNSLYTGLAASTFVFEELKRNQPRYQVNEYNNALVEIWNTYINNQSSWYRDQKRWPQSLFWLRRQKGGVLWFQFFNSAEWHLCTSRLITATCKFSSNIFLFN